MFVVNLRLTTGLSIQAKICSNYWMRNLVLSCINYTQIYAGSRKGSVEGGFQQDKNDVIQFMPGYVERIPEKGAKHASNLAVYTLQDKFIQLLIVNTLRRNNDIFNARLHDKAMSEQGVGATSS